MDNNDTALINCLKVATANTVAEFQSNPADFLFESDIKCMLFANLRNTTQNIRYESQAKDVESLFKFVPNINPVKTEYPHPHRFDVAVLSENQDSNSRIWNQPCRIAIELKLWQADGMGEKSKYDVRKLKDYFQVSKSNGQRFTGIAMLFIHPGAKPEQRLERLEHIEDIPLEAGGLRLYGEGLDAEFPSEGVAFHIVTPSFWKGALIP